MPRLTKSVPNYRKHKASGLSFVELSGVRFYLGPHGTKASKDAYDRLVAEWLKNGRRLAMPTEDMTIVEMCNRYRVFAQKYYVKNGQPTCLHRIKRAMKSLREMYGREAASTFGPLALKTVRESMIAKRLTRRYINELIDCIRRAFKWAASEELIPASVPQALATVAGLRRGKCEAREAPPVEPIADAIVEATLPHLSVIVSDMVRIQRLGAMRPQDICNMRPMEVDRTDDIWIYTPQTFKTEHFGRGRRIFIGPQAQQTLRPYLAREPHVYCFRPAESEARRLSVRHAARKTPISHGNRPGSHVKRIPKRKPGDRFTVSSYRRAIHRACDKAFPHPTLGKLTEQELRDAQREEIRQWRSAHRWSPNRLRHAAGTAIRKQFGLEVAQVLLGHSALTTTQVYAERDLAKGVEVARMIG